MKHKLINFVLFQSIWFIFILSAAHDSLYGALLGFCLLTLQYLHGKKLFADCVLIVLAIVIGFIHDGLLKYFNFIIYHIVFIDFYSNAPRIPPRLPLQYARYDYLQNHRFHACMEFLVFSRSMIDFVKTYTFFSTFLNMQFWWFERCGA